jgi:hypothetical protein
MTEVFELQFKNSIRYGMTYNQFWFDDPQLYYVYEEAYQDELKDKLKMQDILNWQSAYYIRLATDSCLDNKCKFPDKPMFFAHEEEKPKDVYDMLERFKGMVAEVNKNFN